VTLQTRLTSRDLELMPDDGKRYEIIDGELFASEHPDYYHQRVCINVAFILEAWGREAESGQVSGAPGVIFDDDDVAPDIVWISSARLRAALSEDGKLHTAPELIIEVLSPGDANHRRDREAKLKIIDWQLRRLEVYRRDRAQLKLAATLLESDEIVLPLLPAFSSPVESLFNGFT
jgi:Uma2 family endonuclease